VGECGTVDANYCANNVRGLLELLSADRYVRGTRIHRGNSWSALRVCWLFINKNANLSP